MRRFALPLAYALLGAALLSAPAEVAADWGPSLSFPVHSDPATRTIVDAAGRPVVVVGDAAWSLMVQLNQAEVAQYLDDRRSRGFNAVLVNLIEHKFATAPPANRYGQQPFLTPGDFSTPNDAYFANCETVVQMAWQRGMLVLLAPMYLGYQGGDQGWYQELKTNGPAKALAYGRYVGQRFAGYPNVVWVQGGDMPPTDVLAEIESVVTGIQQYNPSILHTAHSLRGNSSLDDYDRPWLGLDAIYTDCTGAQPKARAEWLRATSLPTLHIEGVYENEGAGTDCLLAQVYYSVLNGARGHVFGNRPIWLFDTGWPAALGSEGAGLMQHAADLFRSREGATLVPDTAGLTVTSGAGTVGTADYAAAARTASGKSVLVYVPGARTLQVDTAQAPGPQFVAWWYDPRTGSRQRVGTYTSGGAMSFTTPTASAWVLVLDALSVNSPPGAPQTTRFYSLTPCRVADTRNAAGASGGPSLGANTVRSFPAAGSCGIPTTATAIAVNLTVVDQTDAGDIRVFATGSAPPNSSAINFARGKVRANNAVIPLGTNGQISVQTDMAPGSAGRTHFLFDVTGYFQ